MDAFLLVLIFVSGGAVGVMIAEWKLRAKVLADLKAATFEMRETLGRVNTAHNTLANQVVQVAEQVQTHEFKLTAVKR